MKSPLALALTSVCRLVGAGFVVGLGFLGAAQADSLLTQSYQASGQLGAGSVVSLSANPGVVDAANTTNVDELFGVVANNQSAYIGSANGGGVAVASSGVEPTLVTNLNGNIKVGDRLTASPLNGVAEKTTKSGRIIGVAQASFDAQTHGAVSTSVSDGSQKLTTSVGSIPVLVNVTYYTAAATTTPVKSLAVPGFLQALSQALAGKIVSPLKLWLATLVFLVVLVVCAVALYGAARGGMDSLGRNPLAAKVIRGSFWRVAGAGLGLVLAAIAVVVLILRS